MDINQYYENLDIKKKPKLIISQKGQAVKYRMLSNSIHINSDEIILFKTYEIKFLICHELGYFLRLKSVYTLKILNFLIFVIGLYMLIFAIRGMSFNNFLNVLGFGILIGAALRHAINAIDDYQDFLADYFVVIYNKLSVAQYKAIVQGIKNKSVTHKFNQPERKTNRVARWLQKVKI